MHVAAALPGVNVLSAVTAANLTPPPEIVALAQVSPPRVSRFILFAMTLLLIASTWWLRTTSETRWDGLGNLPPAALCERARTLLDSMPDSAGHSYNAFGYAGLRDAMMFVVASAPRDVALTTATVHSEHPVFWYRERPQPLAAMGAARLIRGSGRPSFDDPPHLAGSQTVFYDMDGKLLAFVRAPVWRTPEMQTPEPSAYLESLWRASGVMNARPMVDSSDRAESLSSGGFQVWRGQLNGTGKPSNVAAITTGSNPVWFARLPGSEPSSPVSKYYPHWLRQAVVAGSIQSLFLFVMVIALPWAWRGYWSGRIDRDGAVRLALLVIVLDFLPSLLGVGHSVTPGNELFRLWIASLRALGLGAAVAILFVVVDFLTRRYWPDVLITWNRLLRLQYRDADVRRHFAVGIAVGCLWACLSGVERLLVERIGWNVRPYLFGDRVVEKLYGLRDAAASLIEIIPEAIITGLLFLLLLILMRILVRNPRVAIGLTALILVPVIVPRGAHILTSWLFLGVGGLGIFLALLTRLGLLASVVGFFVVAVLNTSPLASSLNIWYADVTLLALGSIMALAIFGAVGSGARS
jgi:hypothetical protein